MVSLLGLRGIGHQSYRSNNDRVIARSDSNGLPNYSIAFLETLTSAEVKALLNTVNTF